LAGIVVTGNRGSAARRTIAAGFVLPHRRNRQPEFDFKIT
jgi:hypothetical protein